MKTLTKEEFENLSPKDRGFAVYMMGAREDQPNIPDEDNPYPENSQEYEEWEKGNWQGYLLVLDSEG